MNVPEMVAKYGLKPRGVIQAGSHHGEEIPMWEAMGAKSVHFEPVMSNFTKLKELYPNARAFPMALGNHFGEIVMNTETVNGGQSCSAFKPKTHLEILPWIVFDGTESVGVATMDYYSFATQECNFLYIDTQGYELEILKGAEKTLARIDFIFTEVNRAEVFEGCALIGQIDEYLAKFGFRRVETEWHGIDFGDALYIK